MQTFLPYSDFRRSAEVLDRQRLGKQRVEAYQIIRALLAGPGAPWANHPAVRMWRGHGLALVAYTVAMCDEWTARGYRDSVREKVLQEVASHMGLDPETLEGMCHQDVLSGTDDRRQSEMPPWLEREDLHASHRSNLLRKDSVWYGQFGWTDPHDLEYVWPVPKDVEEDVGAPSPGGDQRAGPGAVSSSTSSSAPTPNQHKENPVADASSNENMNREALVEALRAKGYEGPVSYTKTRLLEMLATLESGGVIEPPKRGRRGGVRESSDKEGTPAK